MTTLSGMRRGAYTRQPAVLSQQPSSGAKKRPSLLFFLSFFLPFHVFSLLSFFVLMEYVSGELCI